MLLDKDPFCKCPNCQCKSFKDISIVNVKVIKNEFGDDMMITNIESKNYQCVRCGKTFNEENLYEYYKKD